MHLRLKTQHEYTGGQFDPAHRVVGLGGRQRCQNVSRGLASSIILLGQARSGSVRRAAVSQ